MDPRDNIPPFLALQEQLAPAQKQRRRERIVRNIMWSVLGTIGLLLVGTLLISRIDPNSFRGRIEAAVQGATGRGFKINGNIRVASWWRMTLVADDVTLANAAWGSRPAMLKLGRVEADVALFPLFSGLLRLPRLALYDADLLLERDAAGQGNWQFNRLAVPRPTASSASAAAPSEPPFAVRTVHLRDLKVSWKNAPGSEARELLFRRLTTSENLREGNISVGADLAWRGQPINVSGSAGSLIRLMDPTPPKAGDPPWGVLLTAQVPGAKVTLAGTVQRPLQASGLSLRLDGVATDLGGIAGIVGRSLPPLRAMTLSAQITDRADGSPQLQNINLQIGSSDLPAIVPGLKFERLILSARNPDDPIQAELRGTVSATDLRATGRFGTLAQLLDPDRRQEPFPVELNANLGESTLVLRGLTAPFGSETSAPSLDMSVTVKLRDLADFSAFAGRRLPTQRPIVFEGRVATIAAAADGGVAGIALRGTTLRMPLAELDGDADILLGPRPELRTVLRGRKLDADGLIEALSKINFGPPSTELPKGALPIRRTERPFISDTPFDLGWMDVFDADVSLGLDELTLGGLAARNANLRLVMQEGRLTLAPFTGTLPGGAFTLRASADSRTPAMPVALRLQAPALDMRPMLLAMGRTEDISGLLEVDADLTATGRSPFTLAGNLTGHLGLAMVDGMVDNALMQPLLGGVMRAARVPSDVLFGPGRSRVRCFAARMDATNGDARLATLVLDVGRTLIEGQGMLRFQPETLDIRLQPQLRITSTGITVPLKLTGRFRNPALAIDDGSAATEGLSALSALSGRLLGIVGNRGADACANALAAVRKGGSGGEALPAAPPPPNLYPHLRPPPPPSGPLTGPPTR
jgi:uncharacterized protein involved in outer membrane biogenesis